MGNTFKIIQRAGKKIFIEMCYLLVGVPVGFLLAFFFFAIGGQLFGGSGVDNIVDFISPVSVIAFAVIGRIFIAWQSRKTV